MTEYVVDEVVENPKLAAHIVISGSFDPDEVTAELGIVPTDVSRRGTQRGTSGSVFHKMDSWSFRVGPRETVEWPAMEEEILNVFEPKATELRALRGRLEFESELLLVAYMSDQTPIGCFLRRRSEGSPISAWLWMSISTSWATTIRRVRSRT